MSSWKGKTRGGLAGYRFFLFILRYLGINFSYFFLRFVVLYFVIFVPKGRKPVFWYFRNILHFGWFKSVRFLFRNFYLLGQVLLDKVALLAGFSNQFTFDFEGEDHIREMAVSGGGLLIGAHMGNWEIAGQLLERIDTKVHIVMIEAEHEKIKNLLNSVMVKKQMDIIVIKDDFTHLFKIKEALQNDELVAIHGDRFLPGSKTMTCQFLGKDAEFPTGPFYLAVKYAKQITFVSAVKQSKKHYHFFATPAKLYKAENNLKSRENQTHSMLLDYVKQLEITVKQQPEQWFNYYYFWGEK
ncbi:MAG: lipid A biosynthesis acyltransferase [Bacteroidetes bacterium]|nr:MAG: lipid A biosynthesis acyltransferase [Bacteroidota bacterium]